MNQAVNKEYTGLGTRAVFNKTLRHLVNVTMLVESTVKGANLADQLNDLTAQGALTREQLSPVLSLVLVDKMNLPVSSVNLKNSITDFSTFINNFKKWNGLSVVLAYHHPNLGVIAINPAREDHWDAAGELKKNELVVAYVRSLKDDATVAEKGLAAVKEMLHGKSPAEDPSFIIAKAPEPVPQPAATPAPGAAPAVQPAAVAPAPVPAPAASAVKKNISPKYSVQVTNELFHNGNVEAWKNIIEAYQVTTKNKVIVFHEGELIQDLNSLFKWGKVKHGGVITFQVMGDEIKLVSRLQKYLFEGASSRYETFLKKDINKVLNIF